MRPISPLTQQAIASSAIIKPNTNFTVRKITSKSFDFVKKFEFFNTPPQNKSQITKQTQQRLSKLTLNPPPLSKALVTAQLPTEKQATSSRENLPAETIKPMPLKKIEIKQTQEQSSKQTLTPPPPPMPPMPPMPSKAQVIIPLPTEKQSTSSRENLLQEIINHKALKKVETKQTPQPKTSQSAPFDGKLKQSSQSKQSVAQDSSAKLLTPQTHKIKQENTALSFKPELILSETLHQEFFSLPREQQSALANQLSKGVVAGMTIDWPKAAKNTRSNISDKGQEHIQAFVNEIKRYPVLFIPLEANSKYIPTNAAEEIKWSGNSTQTSATTTQPLSFTDAIKRLQLQSPRTTLTSDSGDKNSPLEIMTKASKIANNGITPELKVEIIGDQYRSSLLKSFNALPFVEHMTKSMDNNAVLALEKSFKAHINCANALQTSINTFIIKHMHNQFGDFTYTGNQTIIKEQQTTIEKLKAQLALR